ncbi:hypothetical protein [Spirosoma telluris]|uniref:hypothetical protein n=1 Tax=Spirosoma telluris TaxID=2183553 RepID=UPI002FC34399
MGFYSLVATLYISIGKRLIDLAKRRIGPAFQPEYISLGSGLATFVLFSLSGFQLPHYLNIVFPFYAVLTAQFLVGLNPTNLRKWASWQTVIGFLLIIVMAALLWLVQPAGLGTALGWVLTITVLLFVLFRQNNLLSLMGRMVGVMLVIATSLNLFLYPPFCVIRRVWQRLSMRIHNRR